MMKLIEIIDVSITESQTSAPACCPPHKTLSTSKGELQDLLQFMSHQFLSQIFQMHLVLHYDSCLTSILIICELVNYTHVKNLHLKRQIK